MSKRKSELERILRYVKKNVNKKTRIEKKISRMEKEIKELKKSIKVIKRELKKVKKTERNKF